jgi:hypothetical protein
MSSSSRTTAITAKEHRSATGTQGCRNDCREKGKNKKKSKPSTTKKTTNAPFDSDIRLNQMPDD